MIITPVLHNSGIENRGGVTAKSQKFMPKINAQNIGLSRKGGLTKRKGLDTNVSTGLY